ncbi:hypothetical protein E5676_scaffold105G00990 [Cucumis melo var. makuwa]|uniref:Uncharacterized protein n=1 Tax=Cucumis melo var. makuwa TaxID=1194695 RepID=A0A5A7U2B7_CUCMM|nr:hypothetical protein E6C27_scaffold13G001160 [Cucumis melo var. makuwa]TYK07684.1 hypothetical protein E5676_scaffold105G00990 [Cucumis melo var. makuwa]
MNRFSMELMWIWVSDCFTVWQKAAEFEIRLFVWCLSVHLAAENGRDLRTTKLCELPDLGLFRLSSY